MKFLILVVALVSVVSADNYAAFSDSFKTKTSCDSDACKGSQYTCGSMFLDGALEEKFCVNTN